ncbi:MAG: TolC family protein [Deferrisomatales bacterium]|nr:TolC family protein [Deferrisomatales bacterium]
MTPRVTRVGWVAAILAGAVVSGASPAPAGYRDLSRELEEYQPPALHRLLVSGRTGAALQPEPSPSDAEFRAQVDRLREAAGRWEAALAQAAEPDAFYTPTAVGLEGLRPAAADPAAAVQALEDGWALETLETLALLRSAAVQSRESGLRAALEGYSQVENLDSILRRYSVFTASLMAGVGGAENPGAPALTFPFPGVLALKGEIVTQDVRAAREELEAARRDAVTSVRRAYWELLYAGAAQGITDGALALLDNLKGEALARYAAGETTFQDAVKIGIEREKAKEALETLGEEQRNAEAAIRETLNLPPSVKVGAPAAREPDREAVIEQDLYAQARARRQELRALRATIGRMERMLEMAETMIYPGFSLNLSLYWRDEVSRLGAGPGAPSAARPGEGAGAAMGASAGAFPVATTASMGAGLPKMPWFGKDDAYLRETRQRIAALKKDLESGEAATLSAVRQGWFRLDKALREEALFGDRVVPLSQSALGASTRGYSAGQVVFSDLIDSYNGWLGATLALQRARADLGIARAELQAAVGTAALGR